MNICWLALILLILLPLSMTPWTLNAFQVPKFALLLLIGIPLAVRLLVDLSRARAWRCRDAWGWLLFLRLVALSVATLFSVSPSVSFWGDPARCYGWLSRVLVLAVAGVLYWNVSRGQWKPVTILKCLVVSGIPISLYALMQAAGKDPFLPSLPDHRPCSTLGNAAGLADAELFYAFMGLGVGLTEKTWSRRAPWLFASALSFSALLVSLSRAGWVGAFAGLAVLLVFLARLRNKGLWVRSLGFGAACSVLLSLLAVFSFSGVKSRLQDTLGADPTGTGRILLWQDTVGLIKDTGVRGCGLACFGQAFLPHRSVALARFNPSCRFDNAHNEILNTLATEGALGALSVLGLSGVVFFRLWKSARPGNSCLVALPLAPALVAHWVNGLFNFDTLATGLLGYAAAGIGAGCWRKGGNHPPLYGLHHVLVPLLSLVLALLVLAADHNYGRSVRAILAGDNDSSLRYAESASRLAPWNGLYSMAVADAWGRRADETKSSEEARKAEGLYEALYRSRKSFTPDLALTGMIQCRMRLGDASGAIRLCQDLLALDPSSASSHILTGQALLLSGETTQALDRMECARFLDPWGEDPVVLEDILSRSLWREKPGPDIRGLSQVQILKMDSRKVTDISGLVVSGSQRQSLCSVEGISEPQSTLNFPVFRQDSGWQTQVLLFNPSPDPGVFDWKVFDAEGKILDQGHQALPSETEIQWRPAVQTERGWLTLRPSLPTCGWIFMTGPSGERVSFSSSMPGESHGLPRVFSGEGWWTGLSVSNPGETPVSVAVGPASGDASAWQHTLSLPGHGQQSLNLGEICKGSLGDGILIQASQPVCVQAVVGKSGRKGLATACGLSDLRPKTAALFPLVGSRGIGGCTLLAFNPSEESVSLNLDLCGEAAASQRTQVFIPGRSILDLGSTLDLSKDGALRILSSKDPLFTVELILWESGLRRGLIGSTGQITEFKASRPTFLPTWKDQPFLVSVLPGGYPLHPDWYDLRLSGNTGQVIMDFQSIGRTLIPSGALYPMSPTGPM